VIYTFYSFKGGVGRSMAMANVAYELASRGLRVLAIDFDLEAPGLERYFRVAVSEVYACKGVIDLIDAFKRALAGSGSIDDDAEFRQLRQYTCAGIADFGGSGRLDLMPAGKRASEDDRRAYALAVRTFDWQDFYFNWEGEAFFEWLRRTLVGPGEGQYDVVLADSRTGVTEMGGVCACQLADVVVMLSAPNHQNIEGTRELARDLNSPEVQRLRRGRPPLQIVVVPARVEQRLPELRDDFEHRFDEAFAGYRPAAHVQLNLGAHELALPYVPEFAFEEQVIDRQSDEGRLLTERYRHLADALLLLAGDSVPQAQRDAAQARLRPDAGAAPQPPITRAFDPSQRYAAFDAYLSCARSARPAVQELQAALEASGRTLRTQFGEAEAFGTERELPLTAAEQLRHAQALVLFADAQGVRPWQRAEVKLARSLPQAPLVVQVLLPGAAADAFELAFGGALREDALIDLRGWPGERGGAWLLAEALSRGPAGETPPQTMAEPPAESPFPGARPYGEGDATVFSGRGPAVDALRALALSQRRMVLAGPAGAGKTSLVQAGLWPVLRGSTVITELHQVNLRGDVAARWQLADQRPPETLPPSALLVLDHADEGSDEDLRRIADLWARADGPRLLLVWRNAPLAQAEAEAQRRWGAEREAASRHAEHELHRQCHFGEAAEALMALAAKAPQVELQPLDGELLRAAAEAGLARAGRRAEAGLLERLFSDAGPLPSAAAVQRTLVQLWDAQVRGWLVNDAYDRSGGIDAVFCTELQARMGAVAEHEAMNALLLRLMRRGDGNDGGAIQLRLFSWCRSVAQPVFAGRAAALVLPLAAAGLLTVQRLNDDLLVTLAHRPRDWAGLDPVRQAAPWCEPVHRIALAYAAWANGDSGDGADDIIEEADLRQLAPQLSLGEAAFAARRKRITRIAGRTKLAVQLGFGLVVVVGIGISTLQTQGRREAEVQAQAAASAASASERVQRDLAVTAARAQTEQALEVPKASPAMPPLTGERERVVVQISGGGNDGNNADLKRAQALLQRLPEAEFRVVPEYERVGQQICGDVRFHHDGDRAAAQRALELLNAALAQAGDVRRLQLNDRSASRAALPAKAGSIEVWLPPFSDAPVERQHRWGASRLVSAGCALVGSDTQTRDTLRKGLNAAAVGWFDSELPVQRIWLAEYYIGKTEVTMAQFAVYQHECEAAANPCPKWRPRYVDPQTDPQRPATFVSWAQARDYCRWAGGRLPTDLEWEKAARGPDARFWPWGDKPDEQLYQGKAQSIDRPVPVGSFPRGNSPYGVADMAGNVWEYTADIWQPGNSTHSMRGGSYLNTLMESRASSRWASSKEGEGTENLGFRCVADVVR